jgi:hypothetical protein
MESPKALLVFGVWNGDKEKAFVLPIDKPVRAFGAPTPAGISCKVGNVFDLLGPGTNAEAEPGLGKGL